MDATNGRTARRVRPTVPGWPAGRRGDGTRSSGRRRGGGGAARVLRAAARCRGRGGAGGNDPRRDDAARPARAACGTVAAPWRQSGPRVRRAGPGAGRNGRNLLSARVTKGTVAGPLLNRILLLNICAVVRHGSYDCHV